MHKHHSTQNLIGKVDELKQQLNHFLFQLPGALLHPSYHYSNQNQWMTRVFPLSYSWYLLLCLCDEYHLSTNQSTTNQNLSMYHLYRRVYRLYHRFHHLCISVPRFSTSRPSFKVFYIFIHLYMLSINLMYLTNFIYYTIAKH